MKNRNILIKKLVNEGLSTDILVNLNDTQLKTLAQKVLKEGLKIKADDLSKNPGLADKLKDKDVTVVPEEEIVPKKRKTNKKVKDEKLPVIKKKSFKTKNLFKDESVVESYKNYTSKGDMLKIIKEKVRSFANIENKNK